MSPRILFFIVTCALATGCHWGARTGYVEVTSAPVEIEASPYVVYEGHPTYYYGGHWYYRHGSHWHYYHPEPAVLVEHRHRIHHEQRHHHH